MGAFVEAAEDQFDYETDWLEVAEDRQSTSAHFADTAQEDTLMGFVPWNKRRSALRFFKGFATQWQAAGVWRMHREQPHRHPDYPWMRCFDVAFQGMQLRPNEQNPNNSPYDTTIFTVNPVTRRTKYKWAMFAVKYRAFGSMKFLDDADVMVDAGLETSDEWKRNVLWLPPIPNSEALTVTGGLSQLTFSEGGGAGQPTPPPAANPTRFPAPLAELQTKIAFRLLWMGVPWEYLSETDPGTIFWPQKILDRIGRVNSDTFLDQFEPETVRMIAPEFEIYPWWVPSEDVDDPDLGDSLLAVNVTLPFEWFDPPTGIDPPFRKGWNNMPWGGDGKVNGDGRYYRATRDGTNAGRGLLEAKALMPIFTHVSS